MTRIFIVALCALALCAAPAAASSYLHLSTALLNHRLAIDVARRAPGSTYSLGGCRRRAAARAVCRFFVRRVDAEGLRETTSYVTSVIASGRVTRARASARATYEG